MDGRYKYAFDLETDFSFKLWVALPISLNEESFNPAYKFCAILLFLDLCDPENP